MMYISGSSGVRRDNVSVHLQYMTIRLIGAYNGPASCIFDDSDPILHHHFDLILSDLTHCISEDILHLLHFS